MSSFDFDMLSENKEHIKLNPTNNFLKVCTGSLIDDIEYILDHIYVNNNYDFDTTKKEFANMLMNILKRNQSIKKIDIKRICTMIHLSKHWDDFYNNAFITAMLDSKWDNFVLDLHFIIFMIISGFVASFSFLLEAGVDAYYQSYNKVANVFASEILF